MMNYIEISLKSFKYCTKGMSSMLSRGKCEECGRTVRESTTDP